MTIKDPFTNEIFENRAALAKKYGKTAGQVQKRLEKGMSLEEALSTSRLKRPYIIDPFTGEKYSGMTALAKKYNRTSAQVYNKLRRGMSLEEALKAPLRGNVKPCNDFRTEDEKNDSVNDSTSSLETEILYLLKKEFSEDITFSHDIWMKTEFENDFDLPTFMLSYRCDFVLRKKNGNLIGIVETDGEQHFYPKKFGHDNFYNQVQRDCYKELFLKENKIPLLRIPYDKIHEKAYVKKQVKDFIFHSEEFLLEDNFYLRDYWRTRNRVLSAHDCQIEKIVENKKTTFIENKHFIQVEDPFTKETYPTLKYLVNSYNIDARGYKNIARNIKNGKTILVELTKWLRRKNEKELQSILSAKGTDRKKFFQINVTKDAQKVLYRYEIILDGEIYYSLQSVADALGINRSTLKGWVACEKRPIEEAVKRYCPNENHSISLKKIQKCTVMYKAVC